MAAIEERKMIDEIRAFVYSSDQTKSPEIEALARQYAEACRLANERLTRCGGFLAKGLRTQAIQVAEAEPDLLEFVGVLNFEELDEWQEVAGTYGLERFQSLKMDIANSISEAYGIDKQLEVLFKTNRRLALVRAPLNERLAVMREIAAVDVGTSYWREDIQLFEKHRAAEFIDLAKKANGDASQFTQWVTQYEAENWSNEVPSSLQAEYCRIAQKLYEATTLPLIAQHVVTAQRELNLARLSQLRNKWDEIVEKMRGFNPSWAPRQQLQAAVYPAFQFLEQHFQQQRTEAFQRDLTLLEQAIRTGKGDEQVDFLLTKAESHGFALPPMTHAELAEFKRGAKEERALGIAVMVIVIIGAIALFVFGYFMMREMFSS